MPCRLQVTLRNGKVLSKEKQDYEGFLTRPLRWETVTQKFERLSTPYLGSPLRREIVEQVAHLEEIQVSELVRLLGKE